MSDWMVLIVDDDEAALARVRSVIRDEAGFSVAAIARSSEDAAKVFARRVPVDLVVLGVELPGASGMALLRGLRTRRGPEVIAVSGNSNPRVVQDFVHFGVVDYLLKPLETPRLRTGLHRFVRRRRTLSGTRSLAQQQIDRLYVDPAPHQLPPGIASDTLHVVGSILRFGDAVYWSADDVATRSHLSRVTARRYLEYLVEVRQAETLMLPNGPGRPRKLYRPCPPHPTSTPVEAPNGFGAAP